MALWKSSGLWFFLFIIMLALFLINLQGGISSSSFAGLGLNFGAPQQQSQSASNQIEVFFCPQDRCADQLIAKIDSAQKSIYVAIYSFTLDGVADALIRAERRGVEVKVIFDYGQASGVSSDDEKLAAAGIPIELRNGSGYMHNKFIIIDGELVGTGSFNYSANADEKNDENLIFILDAGLAKKYKADFDQIWGLSAV